MHRTTFRIVALICTLISMIIKPEKRVQWTFLPTVQKYVEILFHIWVSNLGKICKILKELYEYKNFETKLHNSQNYNMYSSIYTIGFYFIVLIQCVARFHVVVWYIITSFFVYPFKLVYIVMPLMF